MPSGYLAPPAPMVIPSTLILFPKFFCFAIAHKVGESTNKDCFVVVPYTRFVLSEIIKFEDLFLHVGIISKLKPMLFYNNHAMSQGTFS